MTDPHDDAAHGVTGQERAECAARQVDELDLRGIPRSMDGSKQTALALRVLAEPFRRRSYRRRLEHSD